MDLSTIFSLNSKLYFLFSISFFLVLMSLVLNRNSQLHTACYKRGVFLYFEYAVGEWFKKITVDTRGGVLIKHRVMVLPLYASTFREFFDR